MYSLKMGLQYMDSAVLNDHIEAYVYGAMRHAGIDPETQEKIIHGLRVMFDEYTAAEMMKEIKK